MKKRQSIISIMLFFLVIATFSACKNNEDEPNIDSYEAWLQYALYYRDVVVDGMAFNISDGQASLVEVYDRISGDIKIPAEVYYEGTGKSYPVTSVSFDVSPIYSNVISLSIPNTVKALFLYGIETSTLSIPSSVETLEISGCANLEKLNLTTGQIHVEIKECTKLAALDLPETITYLILANIPITELALPLGIEQFGLYCESLEKISNLERTKIKTLGFNAFTNCKSLKEIYLPPTLETIYTGCCEGCYALTKVHCLAPIPPELKESHHAIAFQKEDNLYVPKGTATLYKGVYPWNMFKEIIEE